MPLSLLAGILSLALGLISKRKDHKSENPWRNNILSIWKNSFNLKESFKILSISLSYHRYIGIDKWMTGIICICHKIKSNCYYATEWGHSSRSHSFLLTDPSARRSFPSRITAAKSLQSCPTLCDPIDSSPPGSPVPGILQARTLERVAISFSNAWKWKVEGKSLSCVRLFTTHGLQPTRLLCPWELPGKSTRVGQSGYQTKARGKG